jgi:hypothetical protein
VGRSSLAQTRSGLCQVTGAVLLSGLPAFQSTLVTRRTRSSRLFARLPLRRSGCQIAGAVRLVVSHRPDPTAPGTQVSPRQADWPVREPQEAMFSSPPSALPGHVVVTERTPEGGLLLTKFHYTSMDEISPCLRSCMSGHRGPVRRTPTNSSAAANPAPRRPGSCGDRRGTRIQQDRRGCGAGVQFGPRPARPCAPAPIAQPRHRER